MFKMNAVGETNSAKIQEDNFPQKESTKENFLLISSSRYFTQSRIASAGKLEIELDYF